MIARLRPCALLFTAFVTLTASAERLPDDPISAELEATANTPLSVELESVLEGFEDSTVAADTPLPVDAVDQPERSDSGRLSGRVKLSLASNFSHQSPAADAVDWRGLSRLRGTLDLQWDGEVAPGWKGRVAGSGRYDLAYRIRGRDRYPESLLQEMESELTLGESYLRGSPAPSFDLTIGRQIVVWGRSETLRVTDQINPLDLREHGIVDIEDLRLPVTMVRLDHYRGAWEWSALLIPELRGHQLPAYGSDYYPAAEPLPAESLPADSLANSEWALATRGIFSGWDLSLHVARLLHEDSSYLARNHSGVLMRYHPRVTLAGAAFSAAVGNWLWRGEAALLHGLRLTEMPGESFDRLDLLAGFDYAGLTNTTLSLDLVNRHLQQPDQRLAAAAIERDAWSGALRYRGEFLHSRLALTALALWSGRQAEGGGLLRLGSEYQIADALNLGISLVNYIKGEASPFDRIADNDRLLLEIDYSF